MKNIKEQEIILSQWKTCVEMSNVISQRRDTMNNIFISLNLAMVTMISLTWNCKTLIVILAGIAISVIWILLINNYKMLNQEKFNIINEMEQNFQIKPFLEEWDNLKKKKNYIDETFLEKMLPIVFILIYLLSAFIIIF